MTDEQIEQLRQEAKKAGDSKQVYLCGRALAGDKAAIRACARVIAEARAQED